MQTPNQVLAVVDKRETCEDHVVIEKDLSIYLDGIQDPGNLGAILRIADWFGIRHVFLSPETVEAYNPKVIQASMGAFLRVEFPVLEIQIRKHHPEVRIFGADLEGLDVFDHKATPGIGMLLVIGNEGNGLSEPARAMLEGRLTIPPAAGAAGTESLNAAVAAGCFMPFCAGRILEVLKQFLFEHFRSANTGIDDLAFAIHHERSWNGPHAIERGGGRIPTFEVADVVFPGQVVGLDCCNPVLLGRLDHVLDFLRRTYPLADGVVYAIERNAENRKALVFIFVVYRNDIGVFPAARPAPACPKVD